MTELESKTMHMGASTGIGWMRTLLMRDSYLGCWPLSYVAFGFDSVLIHGGHLKSPREHEYENSLRFGNG